MKVLPALAAGLLIGAAAASAARQPAPAAREQPAAYMCPMHPDVRGKAGDACPKCGMTLVAAAGDYTPYTLDFSLEPRTLRPNQTTHVDFFVRRPSTGAVVRRFESVHERLFHLFVVGRDLEYFAHLHPVLRENGSLGVDIAVPKAGPYELVADFLPEGGAPQLIHRAVVTAGYTGALSAVAAVAPDVTEKTNGNLRVRLTPPDPRARREQLLTFELHDPASAAPITDLEPYLGANGHLLIASADFAAVFHSHPVAEVSSAHGPTVVFQVLFPQAGMYRLWAQFQRGGRLATVPFTVSIDESS